MSGPALTLAFHDTAHELHGLGSEDPRLRDRHQIPEAVASSHDHPLLDPRSTDLDQPGEEPRSSVIDGVEVHVKDALGEREGMAAAINPFDEYAIEEAVRIKEKLPGSPVSIVTMGPPQAEDALREAIARGGDDAYHVTDRAFAGADP